MKIGFGLLAVVLVGALTAHESRAEDAHQTGHAESAPAATSSEHGAGSPSGGAARSGAETKSADDIDTRISVQPRRTGAKSNKGAEARVKITLPAMKNPHRRVFSVSSRTTRNAVSAPVPQRESTEHASSEHLIILSAPHFGAGGTPSVGGLGGNAAPAKLNAVPILSGSSNPNSHGSTTQNRGINGTTVAHHGIAQAGIGGPAKTTSGVNGTTIRPAH